VSPASFSHATPQPAGLPTLRSVGLDFAIDMQAHRALRPESSSSLSYGRAVHLQLLPTSPHGDAVSFGFRTESVSLKRTYTSLTLRAFRRTCRPAGACVVSFTLPSTYVLGSIITPLPGLRFFVLHATSNSLSEPDCGQPGQIGRLIRCCWMIFGQSYANRRN
jgi:hypothetical protein